MATYDLRRFSNPAVLKSIMPEPLLTLLRPYDEFFAGRQVPLPGPKDVDKIDYEGIVGVFMTPGTDTPEELKEALYTIHEMATEESADILLAELASCGVRLNGSPNPTPADIAVQAYLFDKRLLERIHAEQNMFRQRSFEYYQTEKKSIPVFKKPTSDELKALESDLDDWFETRKRDRVSKVYFYDRNDETWFLVRHGDLYKREGSIKDGKSESVYYRPEKYDVLVYDSRLGELRIHAASKGEKDLYRAKFGLHLFGSEDLFSGEDKYTLKPLQADGPKSLVCDDVIGMEWVNLVEVQYHWGGPQNDIEIRRSDDMFASLEAKGRVIPPTARIIRASFKVRFSDSKKERSVRILPSNVALYVRDTDGTIVEDFLTKRGFINGVEAVEIEEDWIDDVEPKGAAAVVART